MTNANANAQHDHFEADVGAMHVARVYAEALLDAAVKRNQPDLVLEELRELVETILEPNPQLVDFFANKTISKEKKAELLQKVFPGRVSELLANFLLVLNEHERLDLIQPILHAYIDLNNERARRMVVQVRSAVPLLDRQRERLATELRQVFRQEPMLEAQVDPDLLGGLVVRVGDWLYDASVRSRLESLRNQLNERSLHATTQIQ
jgi:F-type H+-transporting ATPase subunit delta